MLERLAGNTALKSELGAALDAGRLPHAILLVVGRLAGEMTETERKHHHV